MIEHLINDNDWPGRDKQLKIDTSEENELHISLSMTHEQIHSIEQFNVDVNALIESTLYNQVLANIQNMVNKSAFNLNVNGTETHTFDNIEGLQKLLKFKSGYALLNVQLAAVIQDYPEMVLMPTTKMAATNGEQMYQIGSFGNVKIYVDPCMKWDDNRCAIIENEFYNFKIGRQYTSVDDGAMAPQMIIPCYINITPPDNTIVTIKSEKPLI